MKKLTKKDVKEINRLRGLFPRSIKVRVERSADGGFCAEITDFPGCFTEANSFSELIEMVNDAVKTYFDIPDKHMPFMPTYIPPVKIAQQLNIFPPINRMDTEIQFELPNREKVAC